GRTLLAEGAQGFWLDLYHGLYPHTTSTDTTASGAYNGLGFPLHKYLNRDSVIGVAKAIKSRVGEGPFVTEVTQEPQVSLMRGQRGMPGAEYGTTTERPRRVGYLDLPEIRRAVLVNGITRMALTKLDALPELGSAVQIATAYLRDGQEMAIAPGSVYDLERSEPAYEKREIEQENIGEIRTFGELGSNTKRTVRFIEEQLGVDIVLIGTGTDRHQIIRRI
ncbi:MAG TPA: adenylosuccinate synthetase, partial [Candidatus Saccharimonadales bacterium]|nr:adenylosuccinate synthetase [Candidatus Saccharimonadales bacterium]